MATVELVRGGMSAIKTPGAYDRVFKDECVFTMDDVYSPEGLYTNLKTWQAVGGRYVAADAARTGNSLYYHQQSVRVPRPKSETGMKEDGSFDGKDFDVERTVSLVVVKDGSISKVPYPFNETDDIPMIVGQTMDAVEKHAGNAAMQQLAAWQEDEIKVSKYADNLKQVNPTGKKISNNASDWKCEVYGTTENLWLNLSDGFIGGGRKNWDGSGGSGGALEHYKAEKEKGNDYPLAVKLGTITPQGADCYCYAPDEDDAVLIPKEKLAQYLAFWGIDIMRLEKTEKTTKELEIEMNNNYDWSKITEGGAELKKLDGAGKVGLGNLGNTCYMNSTMQLMLSMPEVQSRYLDNASRDLMLSASGGVNNVPFDVVSQLTKVNTCLNGEGELPTSKNLADIEKRSNGDAAELERLQEMNKVNVASMRMFRNSLVPAGHEFASNRQQDAGEFLGFFLSELEKAERAALNAGRFKGSGLTKDLFQFGTEVQIKNLVDLKETVYKQEEENILKVAIDVKDAEPLSEEDRVKRQKLNEAKSGNAEEEKEIPNIPFAKSFARLFEAGEQDGTFRGRKVVKKMSMRTMPKYLLVQVNRYYTEPGEWMPKKLECTVPVPMTLEMEQYRAAKKGENGLGDGEIAMPEEEGIVSSRVFEPSVEIVSQITAMGFSENGAKRACKAVNNSNAEEAMNWVFAHMEDPDFNSEVDLVLASVGGTAASSSGDLPYDPEQIMMLSSMGFTEDQVKFALKSCDMNAERAADWLFSHIDQIDVLMEADDAGATALAPASGASSSALGDGTGNYELMGFVSHVGKNTSSGHYVAHIKKDKQWIIFDDEKVAASANPPFEYGYVYCYRQV